MLPDLVSQIPGEKSQKSLACLELYENRATTFIEKSFPISVEKAEGVNVWDADGNCFLDITSFFGVASLGHRPQPVINALKKQQENLIHGMGDVHSHSRKALLCQKISASTFEKWGKGKAKISLSNTGSEAVETALKTALLATGKERVLSFSLGFHGLSYGALLATSMDKFYSPFLSQLKKEIRFTAPFPSNEEKMKLCQEYLERAEVDKIGAVIVEPVQGRGGIRFPVSSFLPFLRKWCDENRILLIFDEIYTGWGRTGKLFACEWDGVVPDILCLGKALAGGMPLSACVAKKEIMDAWQASTGESLHTSTFLGHPLSCAIALACIEEYTCESLLRKVAELGGFFASTWQTYSSLPIRGCGLMWGVDTQKKQGGVILTKKLLQKGIISLPAGENGEVLCFTPPFCIDKEEIKFVIREIASLLNKI